MNKRSQSRVSGLEIVVLVGAMALAAVTIVAIAAWFFELRPMVY